MPVKLYLILALQNIYRGDRPLGSRREVCTYVVGMVHLVEEVLVSNDSREDTLIVAFIKLAQDGTIRSLSLSE